jgi:dihydropyrimidinase
MQLFKERYKNKNDFYSFNLSRPPISVEIDAYTASCMAEKTRCPLYIVHVAAGNVLDIAERFRGRKNHVYIEGTPRFLNINDKGLGLKKPELAVMTPGYATSEDIDRMWKGLQRGEVDTIGTDSGTMTYDQKIADGIIWNMPPGWGEMPTSLALMLSRGVNQGRISLPQLVSLMSTNPAKIFGVYPQKGEILPGSDADITIVDLTKTKVVRAELFPSAGDFTPYEGWELKGWPILTMVRGKIVMEDGKVFDNAVGWGRAINLG